MFETISTHVVSIYNDLAHLETDTIILVILLVISVIVVDGVSLLVARLRQDSGFEAKTKAIGIDGGKVLPTKNYISDELLLAGRPDAVIEEDGFLIPVEHKPLAKKIHDRYLAQLLVYMKLIEVCEGKKPPYGYLILGEKRKRMRIENTPERQEWLQKLINEMQDILKGAPSKPSPVVQKCKKCDVKEHCQSRADTQSPSLIHIRHPRVPSIKSARH